MKKQTIGDRLKLLRTTYRLSQAEFATAVGVSVVAISNIERGVAQNPYPSTLRAIADKFGTTNEWLINGAGEIFPNGKIEIDMKREAGNDNPWKDEAYTAIKEERNRLIADLDFFKEIIRANGLNFLTPVKETA